MVIFALSAVVLFAIAGLAVDAGMSYLTAGAAERAAAAGALEGVTYMPACFTSSAICPSPEDATDAAYAATARNGFTNGGTIDGHPVSVNVSQYPAGCSGDTCDPNYLTVSVSAWVPSTFMRVLGFGDHQVTSTETGYYLPQLSLGQPGAQLGTTVTGLQSGSVYLLRTEGWNTSRSEGDAFTPNPTDPHSSIMASTTNPPDTHGLSEVWGTDYGAITTPSPYNELPNRGGWNYQITVPNSEAPNSVQVQVYNPAFAPDPCTTANDTCYHEDDSSDQADYSVMEYTLFQVNDVYDHLEDIPIAQAEVDPIDATHCSTESTTNLNAISNSTANACGATGLGTAYDARGSQAESSATALTSTQFYDIYHNWVNVFTSSVLTSSPGVINHQTVTGFNGYLTPGVTYRLRVDTLDASGNIPSGNVSDETGAHKGYALRVIDNSGGLCNACSLGAINDLAVYTPITLGAAQTSAGFEIPLVNISPLYHGLTVNFYLYDPGDLGAGFSANDLSIIDPDTGEPAPPNSAGGQQFVPIYNLGPTFNTPTSSGYDIQANDGDSTGQRPVSSADGLTGDDATVNTTWCNTLSGGVGSHTGQYGLNGGQSANSCYNGEWIEFQVTIPQNYAGTSTNCTVPSGQPDAGQPDPICGTYWGLQYSVTGTAGSASDDTFTLVANFGGTPTHLIP
jgi:hypothetical protein